MTDNVAPVMGTTHHNIAYRDNDHFIEFKKILFFVIHWSPNMYTESLWNYIQQETKHFKWKK